MPYAVYESLGGLLSRAYRGFSRLLRARLEPLGLTPPQAAVLLEVMDRPGLTPSAIAATANHDLPTIVGVVDRLEALGYIRREVANGDRRKVCLHPTPRAAAIAERVAAARSEALREVTAWLGAEEAAHLEATLRHLCRLLEAGIPAAARSNSRN